jgi:hypothetical protein
MKDWNAEFNNLENRGKTAMDWVAPNLAVFTANYPEAGRALRQMFVNLSSVRQISDGLHFILHLKEKQVSYAWVQISTYACSSYIDFTFDGNGFSGPLGPSSTTDPDTMTRQALQFIRNNPSD